MSEPMTKPRGLSGGDGPEAAKDGCATCHVVVSSMSDLATGFSYSSSLSDGRPPGARRGFTTTGFFLPVIRGMICVERYLRLEIACHQGKEESVSYNIL